MKFNKICNIIYVAEIKDNDGLTKLTLSKVYYAAQRKSNENNDF